MNDKERRVITSSDLLRQDRIPPGQHVVDDWPILHIGGTQKIEKENWQLRIFGLVENETILDWNRLMELPVTEVKSDWHCVTTWSMLDMSWTGVRSRDLMELFKINPGAKAVMVNSYDGYSTNLLIDDFMGDDVIFAWSESGTELTPEKGGPLRLIVPELYAWKSAKWVNALEFMESNRPGYWEQRGYHMHGDPWEEERYS